MTCRYQVTTEPNASSTHTPRPKIARLEQTEEVLLAGFVDGKEYSDSGLSRPSFWDRLQWCWWNDSFVRLVLNTLAGLVFGRSALKKYVEPATFILNIKMAGLCAPLWTAKKSVNTLNNTYLYSPKTRKHLRKLESTSVEASRRSKQPCASILLTKRHQCSSPCNLVWLF